MHYLSVGFMTPLNNSTTLEKLIQSDSFRDPSTTRLYSAPLQDRIPAEATAWMGFRNVVYCRVKR